MRLAALLSVAAVAHGFGFGGFNLPSIPVFPTALPSIAIPSIPELPSIPEIPTLTEFPSIPADLASLIPDKIPSFAFNRTIPSIPAIPSIPVLPSVPELPSIDIDSYRSQIPDYRSLVPTSFPDPNDILKSLGVSPLPTLRIPSKIPELPTLDDFGIRDNDLLDFWRKNHTLKVPESEQELRDFLGNRTKFDFDRADAVIDKLGQDTGYDVRGSIRMISGLVLNNQSFDQVYKRTTTEFTVYTQRIKEGLQNTFNFSVSQLALPPSLSMLSNDGTNLTLSVIKYARNPYAAISDQRLNSSVVSIMVGDLMGNETRINGLTELINFTLPLEGEAESGACVYWNETVATWSTDGCQLLELVADRATCGCNHLTDFAFIAGPMPSAVPVQITSSTSIPTPTFTTISYEQQTPVSSPHILIAPADTDPTPNGTSPLVIGLASGGALLGAVLLAAAYMNWRHSRRQRIKSLRAPPPAWSNNLVTQVVVKS
jgi:hypothetical protein